MAPRTGRIAGIIALASGIACSGSAESPRVVEVGQPAPAYSAVTATGSRTSTASLAGRVVLLNVWATWCAPCRAEIPYLQRLHDRHQKEGLSIIGVSVDALGEDDKISAFAAEMSMTYPIWRDPDERILSDFMAIGVPASYLIDRTGVLRWKRVGIIRETDTTFTSALERALRVTDPE